MFTRISNFTYGSLLIPNINEEVTNNNVALRVCIQKHEPNALALALGVSLFEDFMAQLELDGEYWKVKADADAKWSRLLTGEVYDSGCGPKKWGGIVTKVAEISGKEVFESILAPYVYYQWSLDSRTQSTGVGESKGVAEGTLPASSAHRRADAWNAFVQSVSHGYPGSRVSLHQYLRDHCSDFPSAELICLDTMTYYDV